MIGHEEKIYPLKVLNITHPITAINIETVYTTWVCLVVLLILCLISRYYIFKKNSIVQFCLKKSIGSLIDLVKQSFGRFIERYFYFSGSLFLFILTCNLISLIPFFEEPTKDINTPLSLGFLGFFYMHKEVIRIHGISAFLKEIFMPINIMFPFNLIAGIIMLPLKVLEELGKVISLSFRLFGNIFGGFIITSLYKKALSSAATTSMVILFNLIGTITGISLLITLFFTIFEGFLQAFIFTVLSLTNMAMAIKFEEESSIL